MEEARGWPIAIFPREPQVRGSESLLYKLAPLQAGEVRTTANFGRFVKGRGVRK